MASGVVNKYLARCPHCGGDGYESITHTPFTRGWVGCPLCKCYIMFSHSDREAIEKWNRRVD